MANKKKKSTNGEGSEEDVRIGPDELRGEPVPVKVIDRRFWAKKHASPDEIEPDGQAFDERRLMPTYVEELETKYQDMVQKFQTVSEAYRRIRDEQQQLVERMEKQRDHRIFEFKKQFFNRLLDVLDNMDRAIQMIEQSSPSEAVLTGIHMMKDQLHRVLEQEGLVKIDPSGETFNPAVAEVVEVVPTDQPDRDHQVQEVLQPGFILDNLLLRPARVRVYQYQAATPAEPPPDDAARDES